MCTLVVATRVWNATPLLVAANRDEQLLRPAQTPTIRDDGPIRRLMPRDLQAGGTWIGLNAAGVFAAITNRFGVPPDPAKASRGGLVERALTAPSAARGAAAVADLDAKGYNPFHLVVADRAGAHIVWSDTERLHRLTVPPGVTIVSERSFGAAESGREAYLAGRALDAGPEPSFDALHTLMATHRDPTFDGACVHWDEHDYGTRTTTLVRLGAADDDVSYQFTDGPPCVTSRTDLSGLARTL